MWDQIEDLDEYEDEVSDLGNDIMFLSSLRKKIDDSLNDSLKPNTTAILQFLKSSKSSRREKKADTITEIPTPKTPKSTTKASTNHPNAHIKSAFDEDK